ncbi:mitochondrial inner membrane protease ATP23 [Oryza brachyantha]|uniref:Mitochondrial inner membrane protease ATP23 n=1 Tax=Oryza brachyantha TaxID=4533 RepID=J3LYZ6_ORYBR|nr:mitochondrial inner membrane protease ATP23 [Oryza brachyantha]
MAGEDGRSGASEATGAEAASASETPRATRCLPFEDCVAGITSALQDPTVRFLRERMEKAGCPLPPRMFKAMNCSSNKLAGSYGSGHGITICCDRMRYQDEINQLLIHELIHAYDDCVVKNMDWKNCAHHACSEIRANHLSGDCHYKRELLRGFMKMRGHEQECVKRRALISVRNNPFCSETVAKDAVEAVWETCYNDTRPFDRAP